MNQILITKLKNKTKKNKFFFKFQFSFSVFIIIMLVGFIFYYIISLQKKEKLSNKLISNYNIYKLYSNYSENANLNYNENSENAIWGIIEIPKINVYYPVFSSLNDDLLKISPCKFYGNSHEENGNICIAGHNYNNSMFFSNLPLLNLGDEIYLYDNDGNRYVYTVFKSYEVSESDLSPIYDYNRFSKELTLVTCNNLNLNRLIVKAKFIEE